ncbi:metal ABC transporter permease [Haladaptatus sp. ZSTT2]|uniref:metal ABC transporter permease n=1 Tax=Haladaptatus sp. ZSTT2 TaxID=3120515 RepID=UPI003FA55465
MTLRTLVVLSVATDLLNWTLDGVGEGMCALTDPFGIEMLCLPFMQRAFIAGVAIGVVAPLIGSFLVHRQLSLIGETLAHTAFAGVAIGLFLSSTLAIAISPYLTALVVAVIAALLIQIISEYTDAYGDVSMAIVLAGGFALGTVIITATGGIAVSINQYLFGSLSTVTRESTGILVALSFVVCAVIALTYRHLLFITFDETAARVASLNVRGYNRLLVVLTAVVVVAAMQLMGVILVAAMLVVPVATAAQIARSFKQSVWYSILVAEFAVVVGITLSYVYDLATGGVIVLVAIAVYAGTVVVGKLSATRRHA